MNIKDLKFFAFLVVSSAIVFLINGTLKLQEENKRLANNQAALLDSMQTYKVADSLNVAKINMLELSLSDYKRYREKDAALIKKLKADKPQTIIKTETKTEYKIKTELRDSIVYKDTLKAINYTSYWTDLHGFISCDTLQVKIINREELILVESLQRKKFLGIKLPGWLFGYRRKTLDVVSRNPNTTIQDIEYVKLK